MRSPYGLTNEQVNLLIHKMLAQQAFETFMSDLTLRNFMKLMNRARECINE